LQPNPVGQAQSDHSLTPTVRSNTDYYTFADFVAPQRGLGRFVVFTLGGALMGSTLWVFSDLSWMLPFGALPGGAAGFVAGLWKPWVTRETPAPVNGDR
jgi:membrane associated rhomboid family serine protease